MVEVMLVPATVAIVPVIASEDMINLCYSLDLYGMKILMLFQGLTQEIKLSGIGPVSSDGDCVGFFVDLYAIYRNTEICHHSQNHRQVVLRFFY